MSTLIKYEFIKILRRRSTLAVMGASLLLTAFLFGLPILQYQTYDQDGVIKGSRGIAHDKKQFEKLAVPLTEEYIGEMIGEYQQLFADPANVGNDGEEKFLIGDAYWNFAAPREKLLDTVAANYDAPGETTGLDRLTKLDLTDGANFYRAREEKIEALLQTPSRRLSEAQKAYWRKMSRKVPVPFDYGYYGGFEIITSSFELLLFALLSVCIAVAPVFSGEYQWGTDAVILSGKYGRTKLVTAKLLAALLFGTLAFTLHVLIACGLPLAAFGTEGANLPVQIAGTTIPYPFTFLEVTLINLGILYLILFAMTGLTLALSAYMKSPFGVLTVIVPVLFIPMFLTPNGTAGLYNLTLFLLPYRAAMPEIGKYISYQFGGAVADVLTVRTVLYAVLTAVFLPAARAGFRKHQISA